MDDSRKKKPAPAQPPRPRPTDAAGSRPFVTGGGRRVDEHLVDGPDEEDDRA